MRGPGSRRNRYLLAQEFGPALGPPERPEQFRDYYTVHPHRPEDRRFPFPRPTIRYITPRSPTPPTPPTKPRRVKIPLGIRIRATRRRKLQEAIANADRTLCTRRKTYHQGRYLLRTHGLSVHIRYRLSSRIAT